jgi:dTDP-4-dehydrorhamnose 3,5-epimerase
MQVQETGFEGLLILQPIIFKDDRGAFQESWNASTFRQLGLDIKMCSEACIFSNHHLHKEN